MEYTTYAEVLQESLKSLEKIDEMVLATEERLSNQKRNLEQLVSNIEWLQANIPGQKKKLDVSEKYVQHDGQILKLVEREAKPGDYVKFSNAKRELPGTNEEKFYKVLVDFTFPKSLVYKDEIGVRQMVYGWESSCPDPKVHEVMHDLPFNLSEDEEKAIHELIPPQLKMREEAKKFIEELLESKRCEEQLCEDFPARYHFCFKPDFPNTSCLELRFVVNEEKRTVVGLGIGLHTKKVLKREIARCAPNDIWDEEIGKAIVLGRMLYEDVSRFEKIKYEVSE
ncbi:hypothetical protein QN089_09400 [Kurthia sp. YJT4]|uniref:hypothetical protein n=1 Tax=Kurthia sp. YJT4 TaxID=3049086 RepID=UPI00254F4FFE|nr:hypothetical protein [Kurthia sp. YJT4]WIL37571.1 hypothetical protein QN089_09400 [Kurthia sp. YJT4]